MKILALNFWLQAAEEFFFKKNFVDPFFQFSEKFWQKKHHDLIIIKFSVLSVLEFLVLVLNFSHRKFPQKIISDILKL